MIKRCFDIIISTVILFILSPIIVLICSIVWLQDFKNPLYIAPRAKTVNSSFKMIKIRSMVSNADSMGGSSTSKSDNRITSIGKLIRKTKLDEIVQLWSVLIGDMSLVGPRPQVVEHIKLYTNEELKLFNVKPGITDFSSIIFSDEGEILDGSDNPDLKYNQYIRPWKSRYGLFYINKNSLSVDFKIILLTIVSVFSREKSLKGTKKLLTRLGASSNLISISERTNPLKPYPPPGSSTIESRY
tara:strand:- start:19030 stop:19758 length:729 start_codon:yes stop_codon:yes gene_type:complete